MSQFFIVLYKIGTFIYPYLVRIAGFFSPKAKKWVKGRENWKRNKYAEFQQLNIKDSIWMHSSSLGEFEQGRTLLDALKKRHPDKKIILTFFSPSGFEIQKNYHNADHVFYLPMDSASNARDFLDLIKPSLIIWVKYDFWYFYLNEIKKRKIPTYLISSIFRSDQWFFKWYGKWMLKAFAAFDKIFVQDPQSIRILENAGIQMGLLAPDTRLDRVLQIAKNPLEIKKIKTFKADKKLFVIGSSWPEDIELFKNFIHKHHSEIKFLIAPHEVEPQAVDKLKEQLGLATLEFSNSSEPSELQKASILILNSIGQLANAYQYADYAYVGGGFGKGIHNIQEAFVFEIPVIFGKKYHKFEEAKILLKDEAVFSIASENDLMELFEKLQDAQLRNTIQQRLLKYVSKNAGGTSVILAQLEKEGRI